MIAATADEDSASIFQARSALSHRSLRLALNHRNIAGGISAACEGEGTLGKDGNNKCAPPFTEVEIATSDTRQARLAQGRHRFRRQGCLERSPRSAAFRSSEHDANATVFAMSGVDGR